MPVRCELTLHKVVRRECDDAREAYKGRGKRVTGNLTDLICSQGLCPTMGQYFLFLLLALGSVSQDIRVSTASMKWMSARTSHARMEAPVSTL